MIIEKKLKKTLIVLAAIVAVLVVIFLIRYSNINNSEDVLSITETDVSFGMMQEEYGLMYTIYQPKVSRSYDKSYGETVYRYEIPFEAENQFSTESVNIEKLQENSCIFSGGNVWQGHFDDWGIDYDLKKGESVKGTIGIEVIPEEGVDKSLYEDWQYYYVSDSGDNQVIKYMYTSNE